VDGIPIYVQAEMKALGWRRVEKVMLVSENPPPSCSKHFPPAFEDVLVFARTEKPLLKQTRIREPSVTKRGERFAKGSDGTRQRRNVRYKRIVRERNGFSANER
jgi:hypothetical protein